MDNKVEVSVKLKEGFILQATFKVKFMFVTYIIGHYNPSVRIIGLVSHTTYVVRVNFIHEWCIFNTVTTNIIQMSI